MKFNKIISAIAAVAMLSASIVSVSAAGAIQTGMSQDLGITVVKNLPSAEEVKARAPKLTVDSIVKLEGTDIKTKTDNAFYLKNKNYDVYYMTYTYSNLGELVNGFSETADPAALGLYMASLRLYGKNDNILATWGANKSFGWADATGCYTSTAISFDMSNPYPEVGDDMEAQYVANGSVTGSVAVALTPGTTATFTADKIGGAVSYVLGVGGFDQIPIQEFEVPASITFGAAVVPDPEVEISARMDLESEGVKGAAWDVLVKNFDSTKKYMATFTDEETNEVRRDEGAKEIDISAVAETEGDLDFAVIMKLTTDRLVKLDIAVQ